ncbi:DEAD/DEAH box helicase [Candidatus Formimonas warabiya]|nr:DEAD/DEAH box helicase [Candidatus Formimonas warabiya]
MFYLSDKMIQSHCAEGIYEKGLSYYHQGRVTRLLYREKDGHFTATVQGTSAYTVQIGFDREGYLKQYACTCPAFHKYFGFCKHTVAVLLSIKNNKQLSQNVDTSRAKQLTREIFSYFDTGDPAYQRELVLEPTLIFHYRPGRGSKNYASLTLSVGEERTYVVKNIKSFLEAIGAGKTLEFSKNFTYDPHVHCFSPADREMLSLFQEVYQVYHLSLPDQYFRGVKGPFEGKELLLPEAILKRWFTLMQGRIFSLLLQDVLYRGVTVREEEIPVVFSLEETGQNLVLRWNARENMVPLTGGGDYFFYQGNVHHLSHEQHRILLPFLQGLQQTSGQALVFLKEDKERFVSELLPHVKKAGRLAIHPSLADKIVERPLQAEIYLDAEEDRITAEVKFVYGDRTINPFAPDRDQGPDPEHILLRDAEKEKAVLAFFENSRFRVAGPMIYLEEEEVIYDFVYRLLPELQRLADVFYSERFQHMSKKPAPHFKGKVTLNGELNLLELDFELEGINREELFALYGAIREKKKYYRLKDGSFLPLASEELTDMADFLDGLDLKQEDLASGRVQVPKYRAMYLDSFFQENRLRHFRKDKTFKELAQSIREPEDTDFLPPAHLDPVLRDYQKTGFKWLKSLAFYGFGGILADDMGLGKTVQAISFIHSERQTDPAPVLVVVPSSVLFNWQAEIRRFSPDLKTLVVSGTKEERAVQLDGVPAADVVITSYPLIRRDISRYRGMNFSACILDEAQYIKNPSSLTARSVKLLAARNFFALTGTPIENSLSELWSIFDFLMPGYLPPYAKFVQKYITPLKQGNGKEALGELSRKVRPFILRRLKQDVEQELPEKIELKMISELTREQKKVYLAYLERIKGEIAGEIAQNGFEKSRIKILAGMTRLRQICCHPSLFLENYQGESGKLTQLAETLADLRAGGHRCLLFSQFTSMLSIIRHMLDREKRPYFYLDGAVDAKERLELVDAFNRGERDLFLISLKAGGTGLNLTGADTVIHFDPWWNPAVEDQATDRAHRIGQVKNVHVLKFISLGTIEEKIYELQQRKKEMIRQVIAPGETFLSQLNEQEIKEILEI